MKQRLTDVFVRAVTIKVQDCSSPTQLRAYLNKYRNYIFSPKILSVFQSRINFFKREHCGDSLSLGICEDLEDILEFEIEMVKLTSTSLINSKNNNKKLIRSIQADPVLFSEKIEEISLSVLKSKIIKYRGDLKSIALDCNLSIEFINMKIRQNGLTTFLRHYKR